MRAWELHEQGWRQQEIAAALGVTKRAVSQWMRRVREGGHKRRASGANCRLTAAQQARVLKWLQQRAEAHGFRGYLWTRKRVAALIERKLGVR